MKNKKWMSIIIYIVSLLLSFLLGWYVLNSALFGLAYSIVVLLVIFNLQKKYKKMSTLFKHIDSAYYFVELMNLQMLSTTSLYEAYKSVEPYVDVDFASMSVDDISVQLLEIANDYNLNAFKMYVKTMLIYDSNGGIYKEMQDIPTSLCQKTKIYYNKLKSHKFNKLVDTTTLYGLWIFILIFIKVSIPEYYLLMLESATYQLIMLLILIGGTMLYYMSICEYYKNKIRGL